MTYDHYLDIVVNEQALYFYQPHQPAKRYLISTGAKGTGQSYGSEQTPLGWHHIHAKVGDGQPAGTVFVAREPTGEMATPEYMATQPERDWIVTRILWLAGTEPGLNQGGEVDTLARKIYIHGTPDEQCLGHPGSRGCIRMRNDDIIELFAQVPVGLPVRIRV